MIKHISQLSKKDRDAILAFVEDVKKLLGTNLISLALFGSKATGQDTPESDIDILVLVREAPIQVKDSVLDLAFEVNLKNNVYISPRVISRDVFEHPVWRITPFIRSLKSKGVAVL